MTFHPRRNGFCWTVKTNTTIEIKRELVVIGLKFKIYTKGQLISKGLFGILTSSKNQAKEVDLTTMIPQVDFFSFIFWKNLKTPKIHFEINWPLRKKQLQIANLSYYRLEAFKLERYVSIFRLLGIEKNSNNNLKGKWYTSENGLFFLLTEGAAYPQLATQPKKFIWSPV